MHIRLNFSDPLSISPLAEQDTMFVQFNESKATMFYSAVLDKDLDPKSWLLKSKVAKQMPLTEATETFGERALDLQKFLNTFLIVSIVMFVIGNTDRAMRAMFLMMRTLQLMMHMPLMRFLYPANVMILISVVIPVVAFDVME